MRPCGAGTVKLRSFLATYHRPTTKALSLKGIRDIVNLFAKNSFLPKERKKIEFTAFYLDDDAERLLVEFKAPSMDYKWNSKVHGDGWVTLHRSWTGNCIYAFQLAGSPAGGARVIESWVNTDKEQYNVAEDYDHQTMLSNIIQHTLLRESI